MIIPRSRRNSVAVRDDLDVAAEPMDACRAAVLRAAELTYAEVGMTRSAGRPVGYRTFKRAARISPTSDFASLRGDLLSWAVQSRSGIRVASSGDVSSGAVVDLRIGLGRLAIVAPCRVVYVIDEPTRCGFAYGTLPGHPESGEEAFLIERTDNGAVTFTVAAFSRPATMLTKLAGPIGHRVQDLMTGRYLRALG